MLRFTTAPRTSTPLIGRLYTFAQHEARAARARRGLPFGGLFGAAPGAPAGSAHALQLQSSGYGAQGATAAL